MTEELTEQSGDLTSFFYSGLPQMSGGFPGAALHEDPICVGVRNPIDRVVPMMEIYNELYREGGYCRKQ